MVIDLLKKEADEILRQQTVEKGLNPDAVFVSWFNHDSNHSGKCGENVIKKIYSSNGAIVQNEEKIVHDFYDVAACLPGLPFKSIEVKTARLDSQGCFQFDGITPSNEFDNIIFLAVTPDGAYVKTAPKSAFYTKLDEGKGPYSGKERWCLFDKKLAPMHKGTLGGGLKLTISKKVLVKKYGFIEFSNDNNLAVDAIMDILKS